MGYVSKERGRYRARYRNPLGRTESKTFRRKADAERFLVEVESEKLRGNWLDPRDADIPVAAWAETFLSLCRRLSPTTYRHDLERCMLPRFGAYRLGRLPAEQIEQWLNDEVAAGVAPSSIHRRYRTLRTSAGPGGPWFSRRANAVAAAAPRRVGGSGTTAALSGRAVPGRSRQRRGAERAS